MKEALTRRQFVQAGSAIAAGVVGARLVQGQAQEKLRCGQIGVGGRGGGLLQSVLQFDDVDMVAICDVNPGNLKRACDAVEQARGKRPQELGADLYEYRKLLASDEVDCVVIATPCNWHGRMYVDALSAGKPFYGEKPLAITAGEIKEILAARKRHPEVPVQIGFQWGAHRGRADSVRRTHEGEIGDLLEGRFARYNGWGAPGGWYGRRQLSGDWMLEQACHEFNLMWWVTQQHPLAAYTRGQAHVLEPDNRARDVTDFYTTVLEYPNGLVVHYSHGWISPPGFGGMTTQFVGTKGGLDVLGAYIQFHGEQDRRAGQGPGGDTGEHLRNLFDAARAGKPEMTYCGIDNGVAASYIGLMIRKSLDEKRRVTFEDMVSDRTPWPPLIVV